jgi:hypothetical protein
VSRSYNGNDLARAPVLKVLRDAARHWTPSQANLHATNKELQQILRFEDKLRGLWKSGKPVQPEQVLKFGPQLWEAAHGIKLRAPLSDIPWDLFQEARPDNRGFFDMMMLKMVSIGGPPSRMTLFDVEQLVRNALYPPFIYMAAAKLGPPNVFEIHDALFEKLLNTDVSPGLRASDVRMPFRGLYVRIPTGKGILESHDAATGWHEVSMFGFAEGYPSNVTRSIIGCTWGEPNKKSIGPSDDSVTTWSFPLDDKPNVPLIEQLEAFSSQMVGPSTPATTRFYGQTFSSHESMALMYKFVVNFCLYLSSPNPDVQPTKRGQPMWKSVVSEDAQPRRTRVKAPKRTSKGLKKKFKQVWDVGRNVKALERTYTASDILTRGHFKRQPYGPGGSLRKIIWREPYISRRKTGRSAGHDYDVEN